LALKRWDSPPDQHPLEGNILEWVRRRLRESPASAAEAFAALPLPHRRVFAARRLEAEVEGAGFEMFFDGCYAALAPDALEALRAFGADDHARVLEEAIAARKLWLHGRRHQALEEATRSFLELDAKSSLMTIRARYIARETEAFKVHA
jgi:hypothetical protein